MDAENDAPVERLEVRPPDRISVPEKPSNRRTLLMSDSEVVAVLAALGHQVRLNLWRLLVPYGETGLAAGTLAARMAILPSSLSFHLRLMTQAGILRQRRSSRSIIYAVNAELLAGMAVLFTTLASAGDVASEQVPSLSSDD